jgi:hypothetical protein
VATKAKRALTGAERQARYREKHMESVEGDKERAQFIFEIGTKKRLARIARHHGLSVTALIERWSRLERISLEWNQVLLSSPPKAGRTPQSAKS